MAVRLFRRRGMPAAVIFLALLAAVAGTAAALCGGAEWYGPSELLDPAHRLLLRLRLERIAAAAVVGAALAAAGAAYQAVLRNVLADPYVLGISGGASLGAALAILCGGAAVSALALPGGAFAGALLVLTLVLAAGGRRDGFGTSVLLAGVIAGSVCGSVLMLLISIMGHRELNSIVWWLLGNLQVRDPRLLPAAAILTAGGAVVLQLHARASNALSLGGEMAHSFGVPPVRTARLLLATASLLTAAAVSLAGIIGFVGLVVPHAMRLLVGADHRRLYPAALFGGAWFLIVCDLGARSLYRAQELPVGVVTALLGGPFFLLLLYRNRRNRPL